MYITYLIYTYLNVLNIYACLQIYMYMEIKKEKTNETRFRKYIKNSAIMQVCFRLQSHRKKVI